MQYALMKQELEVIADPKGTGGESVNCSFKPKLERIERNPFLDLENKSREGKLF